MFWRDDVDPDHEPHRVLIKKGEFVDADRNDRVVPYKIYYPVNHDMTDLPVIVWSHGLGGSRDGAAFLARFIASNGYVVVHSQHAGTDTGLWEGKPGHPWDVIRKAHIPRSASLDRFRDIPFLLDCLEQYKAENSEIGEHMNLDVMGMCGHSFGALTTQVMAGMMFPNEDDVLEQIQEDRFKAGILYSFVPMGHLTDEDPEKVYGTISLPMLYMTGTADDSPVEHFDYTYRLPVYEKAGADEKMLMILEDGDHMVFTGSRGKLETYPKRKIHEEIIKISSLAYWEWYLKGDQRAKHWLTEGGFATYLGDEANITVG